jgi:hypothetical protein
VPSWSCVAAARSCSLSMRGCCSTISPYISCTSAAQHTPAHLSQPSAAKRSAAQQTVSHPAPPPPPATSAPCPNQPSIQPAGAHNVPCS